MKELEVIKELLLKQINDLESVRKSYFDFTLNRGTLDIFFGCNNIASSISRIDNTIIKYEKYIDLIDEYRNIYKNNYLLKENDHLLNYLLKKREIRDIIKEYASNININEERNKHCNGKIDLETLEFNEVLNALNFESKIAKRR